MLVRKQRVVSTVYSIEGRKLILLKLPEMLQALPYEACDGTYAPQHMPKTLERCKKSTPCLIQKPSRCAVDHMSKTMLFIFHFLYNTKIFRENHVYLFYISLVQW